MRVAVAGLGWWGRQIIACLKDSPQFEVVYGVDPQPAKDAVEFLSRSGIALEAELASVAGRDDVDGVVLASPHTRHEEQCLTVLDAGKELFCEKPLAMTGGGAKRILDASERTGKVLGIGHERRFEPGFEAIGRLVADGALGKLLLLEANISHDLFRSAAADNWRLNKAHAPAGLLTGVGLHITDLFISLAGPVSEVRAQSASLVFQSPATDFVSASLTFKSGARASLTSLSCTPFYGRVVVFGDRGWVEVLSEGNVDQGKPTIVTQCSATNGPRVQTVYNAVDAVRMNFEAWAAAVAGKAPYRFTRDQLIENVRVFEAIVKSADEGGAAINL